MFVPFLDEFDSLVVAHSLPFQQLIAFCLSFDTVQDGTEDACQSQKASPSNVMTVNETRESDTQ
jgi:hypothetical protein